MGLEVVAQMIAAIGAAAKSTAKDLSTAAVEADRYRESVEAAQNTTSGMTSAGSTSPGSLSAALQSQAGRR